MKITSVIFDLDGTLIDSSEGVVAAVNYSLEMVGESPKEPAAIKRYIGYPLDKMYPDFTDQPVAVLKRHFQEMAARTVVASTVALDGVEPVLRALRADGYRMAIATTKIKPHIEGILDRLSWRELFDAHVGGNEVTNVKPAPDVFIKAIERLDVSRDECIVVGDTVNDILAARSIELPVIAVKSPYGNNDKLKQAGPDHFLRSIGELPGLLLSITGGE